MQGVAHTQAAQHSPLYVRLTRVHSITAPERVTADGPMPIEALIEAELHRDDGTPEWRAWVTRAAGRLGITGCPDTIEELLP